MSRFTAGNYTTLERRRWKSQLDKFLQLYAVEKARIEARKQGHTVTEQQLQDGSIKLVVQIGGAA